MFRDLAVSDKEWRILLLRCVGVDELCLVGWRLVCWSAC